MTKKRVAIDESFRLDVIATNVIKQRAACHPSSPARLFSLSSPLTSNGASPNTVLNILRLVLAEIL